MTDDEKKRKKDKDDAERVKVLKAGDDDNDSELGKAASALLRNREMKDRRAREILLQMK